MTWKNHCLCLSMYSNEQWICKKNSKCSWLSKPAISLVKDANSDSWYQCSTMLMTFDQEDSLTHGSIFLLILIKSLTFLVADAQFIEFFDLTFKWKNSMLDLHRYPQFPKMNIVIVLEKRKIYLKVVTDF